MTLQQRYWGAAPKAAPLRITVGTITGDITVEDRAVARDTIQAIRRLR